MIFVDSSVWIDFFNGCKNKQTDFLLNALGQNIIIVGDIVLTEVLQGFKKEKDFQKAKKLLTAFDVEPICDEAIAIQSAKHFRKLKNKGVTIRKTIDCIIATFCIKQGYFLLHNDKDFLPFCEYLKLKICC